MRLPIAAPPGFRIIAHRGASAYAPENTAAAFDLAARMQITEIELDTQLTTDGRVALCHDESLARYGHGDRIVEESTWPELAALDMGSWFSPFLYAGEAMLTLDQLFGRYGEAFIYHIELKGRAPDLARAVHTAIVDHGLMARSFITSFHYESLAAMRAIDSSARLGWLVHQVDNTVLEQALALGLHQLCPKAGTVTAELVAMARTVVPDVRAWGLSAGDAAQVRALVHRVIDGGCDGMTIDWPDWVRPAK